MIRTILAAIGATTITVFTLVFAWVISEPRRQRRRADALDRREEQERARYRFGAGR